MRPFKTLLLLGVAAATVHAQGSTWTAAPAPLGAVLSEADARIGIAAAAASSPALMCDAESTVVPTMRAEGLAEPVGDIFVVCTGGTPGPSTPMQVTITLNTNLTGRTLGAASVVSEALLLIDEPLPDQVNMSNGFPYKGQVLGKPGIAAGSDGSGNAYLAEQSSATSVTWAGIPFVNPGASGTRTLRITNLRANATTVPIGPGGIGEAVVTISATIPVTDPNPIVGLAEQGLTFSTAFSSPSTVSLTFQETFATGFRQRITNNAQAQPFSMSRQDVPGVVYNTESQFTPCFYYGNCDSPPGSPIGLANNGTLLMTQLAGLGASARFLSVPNQVTDTLTGAEAYLITGGKPVMTTGNTSLPVTSGTIEVLYEITADNPLAIDVLSISATLLDVSGAALAFPSQAVFAGHLAPLSNAGTASPSAPEPRFAP